MPELPTSPTVHRLACPACRYIAWRPRVAPCGHTVCGPCHDLGLRDCPVCGTRVPRWHLNWAVAASLAPCLDVSKTLEHRRATHTDELVRACLCETPRISVLASDLSGDHALEAIRRLRKGEAEGWSLAGRHASGPRLVVCVEGRLLLVYVRVK